VRNAECGVRNLGRSEETKGASKNDLEGVRRFATEAGNYARL